jgi:hypothetical protein
MLQAPSPTYRPTECGRFICEVVEHLDVVRLLTAEEAEAHLEAHRLAWENATKTGFWPKAMEAFRKAGELHRAILRVRILRLARAA